MTTAAYRDGIIAADTQLTHGKHIKGTCHKIVELRDGLVYVAACDLRDEEVFKDILLDKLEEFHEFKKDFEAIVFKDGSLYMAYQNSILSPLTQSYIAIGTGWEIAMAAMMRGDSAEEAVKLAAAMDIYTSEPIDTYDTKITQGQKTNKGRKARAT